MGVTNSLETTIGVAEAKSLVEIVLRHQGFAASSKYCQIDTALDEHGNPLVPSSHSVRFNWHAAGDRTVALNTVIPAPGALSGEENTNITCQPDSADSGLFLVVTAIGQRKGAISSPSKSNKLSAH